MSILYGIVGGIIAWVATEFLGKPVTAFYQFRHEAIVALARYEDEFQSSGNPDRPSPTPAWLRERQIRYDEIGVALKALSVSHPAVARFLRCKFLGAYRMDARRAGIALRLLGQFYKPTQDADRLLKSVRTGLHING